MDSVLNALGASVCSRWPKVIWLLPSVTVRELISRSVQELMELGVHHGIPFS